MTEEQVTDIANKWMEIADVDQSGTIDFIEFRDLVQKLDEAQTEDSLKELFETQDDDKSGELSVEHFGKALYESVKLMKHEEGEGEDEDN